MTNALTQHIHHRTHTHHHNNPSNHHHHNHHHQHTDTHRSYNHHNDFLQPIPPRPLSSQQLQRQLQQQQHQLFTSGSTENGTGNERSTNSMPVHGGGGGGVESAIGSTQRTRSSTSDAAIRSTASQMVGVQLPVWNHHRPHHTPSNGLHQTVPPPRHVLTVRQPVCTSSSHHGHDNGQSHGSTPCLVPTSGMTSSTAHNQDTPTCQRWQDPRALDSPCSSIDTDGEMDVRIVSPATPLFCAAVLGAGGGGGGGGGTAASCHSRRITRILPRRAGHGSYDVHRRPDTQDKDPSSSINDDVD